MNIENKNLNSIVNDQDEVERITDEGNDNSVEENVSDQEVGDQKKTRFFTQQQVNKMMAEEKRQGKSSVLKALGFNSLEEAVAAMNKDKANDIEDTETKNDEQDVVTNDAGRYKYLVNCIKEGADIDDADDVVDLVLKRQKEGETFESALKAFKKAKPNFFQKAKGTGNAPTGNVQKKVEESLGARLGKNRVTSGKNPYFND